MDLQNDQLLLTHLIVGPIANNVYFLTCRQSGESLMVDAATDDALLVRTCSERNVKLVLETHGHWDHIGSVNAVRAAGLPVHIGEGDEHAVAAHDGRLADGEVFEVGSLRIRAHATPGHTPGSFCFSVDGQPILFTGDTLFPGGPGATHFPGGDFDTIIESINRLYAAFDDNTVVYPGHGLATTIGAERPHMAEWIEKYGPK